MNTRLALLLPLALLAACDSSDAPAGDKPNLKIDTPGFKADISLPVLGRMSKNMDIDGVRLYPESRITGVEIDAKSGRDDGRFTLRFDAPADPAKVATWFQDQFAKHDFQAQRTPTGFAGTKADGDWFTLDLIQAGAQTRGEFKLGRAGA